MRVQRYRYKTNQEPQKKLSFEKKCGVQIAVCAVLFASAFLISKSSHPYLLTAKEYVSKALTVSTSYEEAKSGVTGIWEKIRLNLEKIQSDNETQPVDNIKPESEEPMVENTNDQLGMTVKAAAEVPAPESDPKLEPAPDPNGLPAFRNPLEGEITSVYGERVHPITNVKTTHNGIDIAGRKGETIISAAPGTVIRTGCDDFSGNYVQIKHNDAYDTTYAHLDKISVVEGEVVDGNTKIGEVGETGLATGPHLHLEVQINGERTDPEQFFLLAHRKD